MPFKEDILGRIKSDFGDKSNEVIERLNDAIKKSDYLKIDRIIRCIIFLSKGNIRELDKYIDSATYDTRDVMFWAEYETLSDNIGVKRIRDFNKTFEECSDNVTE